MIIIYHNDNDGFASAYIASQNFYSVNKDTPIKFIKSDYNISLVIDETWKDQVVYILDFSVPLDVMKEIHKYTTKIIWIDHHKTAIDVYDRTEFKNIDGIRDITKSGCLLTWEYFNKEDNKSIPDWVKYVDDFDTWNKKFNPETDLFSAGTELYNRDPESSDCLWDKLNKDKIRCQEVIEKGQIVYDVFKNVYKKLSDRGYEIKFNNLSAFVVNTSIGGSFLFGDRINKYDICISFMSDGTFWKLSFYSVNPNVNCGEVAKTFGGGGHKGAAGAFLEKLPDWILLEK